MYIYCCCNLDRYYVSTHTFDSTYGIHSTFLPIATNQDSFKKINLIKNYFYDVRNLAINFNTESGLEPAMFQIPKFNFKNLAIP